MVLMFRSDSGVRAVSKSGWFTFFNNLLRIGRLAPRRYWLQKISHTLRVLGCFCNLVGELWLRVQTV